MRIRRFNIVAVALGVFILLALLSLALSLSAHAQETNTITMTGDHDLLVFTKTAEISTVVSIIWGIEGTPGVNYEFPADSEVITATVPTDAETLHVSVGAEWELRTEFEPLGSDWYQIPEPERFQMFLPLVASPPKVITMAGDQNQVRFEKSSSVEATAYVLWGVSGTPREDLAWDGNVSTLEPPEGATTMWFAPPEGWTLETEFTSAPGPDWWNIPPVR
jgi:hypothetical protein